MRSTALLALLVASSLCAHGCGPGASATQGDASTTDASTADASSLEDSAVACPEAMPRTETAAISAADGTTQIVASFTAPADPWGGVLEVEAAQAGFLGAIHYGTSAAQSISLIAPGSPRSVVARIAVAPGHTYSVSVGDFSGSMPTYQDTLTFRYQPLRDCFEPNNDRTQAKPVTLGATVEAYLHSGIVGADHPTADDYVDWYRVTVAAAGTLRATVNAPVAVTVGIFDATGVTELAGGFHFEDRDEGQSAAVTPGTYLVRVGAFSSPCPAPGACTAGEWTRPYRLTTRLE